MKKEHFSNALDHIDYELVDEFVKEKEALQIRRARRKAMNTLIPIAACLVILVGVGAGILGYLLGFNKPKGDYTGQSEHMQIFFEKEGIFVFEYDGKLYQALVLPMGSSDGFESSDGESVSIKNVGELISTVSVTDKNGNVATLEIYTSKGGDSVETGDILLKLDSGYFVAKGVNKNIN